MTVHWAVRYCNETNKHK